MSREHRQSQRARELALEASADFILVSAGYSITGQPLNMSRFDRVMRTRDRLWQRSQRRMDRAIAMGE